jgi:tetratricopeptide (TPR) repeat protein
VQVIGADESTTDVIEGEQLFALLDGLPLAIAQAGAYLHESGVKLETYLRYYEQQWSELMKSDDLADAPLLDYPNRSVWTTWTISYQAIRDKHAPTANLLLLCSFLDNKDLWHGFFAAAHAYSTVVARMLSRWIGDIAGSELEFNRAMRLLRNYSLVEEVEQTTSYAMHPVVHQWAYHSQGKHSVIELSRLAVVTVGCAVLDEFARDYYVLLRRFLPHMQACSRQIVNEEACWRFDTNKNEDDDVDKTEEQEVVLYAIHELGIFYADQCKLGEAEQMYERALQGREEALGPTHMLTLNIVNNLGILYTEQGKLVEAEQMYKRALQGREEALGPTHKSTLDTVNNLGVLYADQGKLGEAEQMYERALQGNEEALGPTHMSILDTVNNLGILYRRQGKLVEAEQMYKRALQGKEEALGPTHMSTLGTVNNLGNLYADQGKLAETEQMYERALQSYEEALGVQHVKQHVPALNTINNLGSLYNEQDKLVKAEQMYERALQGREEALGPTHTSTLDTVNNLGNLYADQGKLAETEQMYERALQSYEEALGVQHVQNMDALDTLENLGDVYASQGEVVKAQAAYTRALSGLQGILGQSHSRCTKLAAAIDALTASQNEKTVSRSETRKVHSQSETTMRDSQSRHLFSRVRKLVSRSKKT